MPRRAVIPKRDGEGDVEAASPCAVGKILERRREAEVIERGRSQLADQRAQARDLGVELTDRLRHQLIDLLSAPDALVCRERQPERGEVLKRLVVELPCPPGSLLLGGGESLAAALGLDRSCGRDRGGGARRERFEQTLIIDGEFRSILVTVDRDEGAVPLTLEGERHDHARPGFDAETTKTVLRKRT